MIIRKETPDDIAAIREVNEAAFETDAEARLVDLLREKDKFILSLVAEKEKGVVNISSFSSRALMAICKAIVPFDTKKRCFAPRYFFNLFSSSRSKGPSLVTQLLAQILSKYLLYSSKGGKYVFVTLIIIFI